MHMRSFTNRTNSHAGYTLTEIHTHTHFVNTWPGVGEEESQGESLTQVATVITSRL